MINLICAALYFVGIHLCIAGTRLRDRLTDRFGEKAYRLGFSVATVLGLLWIILAYRNAPYIEWWGQLTALKPLAGIGTLLGFVLLVLGRTTPSPTVMGQADLLRSGQPATGVLRITRHPALWGIALWAAVHLLINGDASAFVLFGSLLVLALAGMPSIDAKRRRKYGEDWARYAAETSLIPFVAIAQGRNRLDWKEIGWKKPLIGALVWALFLHFHEALFGVSPLR